MLRTSNYTIFVDLPDEPDNMLLVHGYSGAYDKISKRVATYVRSLSQGPAPKPLFGDWSPEPPIEGEVHSPTDATVEILKHPFSFHRNCQQRRSDLPANQGHGFTPPALYRGAVSLGQPETQNPIEVR